MRTGRYDKPSDLSEESDDEETLNTPEEASFMNSDKEDEPVFFTMIAASETISQRLHREAMSDLDKNSDTLPEQYQEFESVFSKSSFDQLPVANTIGTELKC